MTSATALKLPSPHEEAWRWSALNALSAAQSAAPQGFAGDVAQWLPDNIGDAPLLVFVDGVFQSALSRAGEIKVTPAHFVSTHVLAQTALAHAQSGWQIEIGRTHASHGTIHILHIATGGTTHLAAHICMAEDAQATLLEHYVSAGDAPSWVNVALQIELARSARLMRHVLQNMGKGSVTLHSAATVGQGASLDTVLIAQGADMMRAEQDITLSGVGAFASVDGILLGKGAQHYDVHNVLRHKAQGGMSRQTWRSVLDDQSVGAIAARVEVAREAQETDATQSLKALLLARGATANAKPELEIFADNVQCAHGATVGELDATALFYLQARGLPLPQARALLTQAFVGDVLAHVGDESLRAFLTAQVERGL